MIIRYKASQNLSKGVEALFKKKKRTPAQKRARAAAQRKRLREWVKFLKEDRDFDWAYILRVLKYKLERTRKFIVEKGNTEKKQAKATGRGIKEVETLIERVLEHDYQEDAFRDFYRHYGRPKMITIPATKEEQAKNPHLGGRLEFLYRNGKPATDAMRKESRRLYKVASKAQVDDLKKAFALIVDRIFGWWD